MTSQEDDAEDTDVGYRRPPATKRFTKGRGGNPAGRPRGRRRQAPYEAVLGRMVTIREDGIERRVTAAKAFLLQLAKRGLEGDSAAVRATLAVLKEAGKRQSLSDPSTLVVAIVDVCRVLRASPGFMGPPRVRFSLTAARWFLLRKLVLPSGRCLALGLISSG
jgi:Family of unknown function (DUF5681)